MGVINWQNNEINRVRYTCQGLSEDIKVIVKEERRMASLTIEHETKGHNALLSKIRHQYENDMSKMKKKLEQAETKIKELEEKANKTDSSEQTEKRHLRAQTLLQRAINELESAIEYENTNVNKINNLNQNSNHQQRYHRSLLKPNLDPVYTDSTHNSSSLPKKILISPINQNNISNKKSKTKSLQIPTLSSSSIIKDDFPTNWLVNTSK